MFFGSRGYGEFDHFHGVPELKGGHHPSMSSVRINLTFRRAFPD
jgi:hypothetical protein